MFHMNWVYGHNKMAVCRNCPFESALVSLNQHEICLDEDASLQQQIQTKSLFNLDIR
uniref:Uncharacterized protein n=1 Tax=Rhizophora mucronata TaxID=61149 RepID=A0A2P2N712_RHIMU